MARFQRADVGSIPTGCTSLFLRIDILKKKVKEISSIDESDSLYYNTATHTVVSARANIIQI